MHDHDAFSPFVVFGASKSGTTWLQKMLNAHPEIRCHFQRPIFPLTPRTHPQLWQRGRVAHRGSASPYAGIFPDERAERHWKWENRFLTQCGFLQRHYIEEVVKDIEDPEQRAVLHDLHVRMLRGLVREILCDTPDKSIFGTKEYTDIDLLFEVFPRARLIHIVRDGRDVCVSKRFHMLRMNTYFIGDENSILMRLSMKNRMTKRIVRRFQRQFGWFGDDWFKKQDEALFTRSALTKLALDWKYIVEYILDRQERYADRVVQVRYEELRTDPEGELTRVLAFLNADTAPAVVREIVECNRFERIKAREGKSDFFRKGVSGDWRNHFTAGDLTLFEELAGATMRRLGYVSPPEPVLVPSA